HVERGVDVSADLVATVQDGERGHRAQLALLLRADLDAVHVPCEEHAELAGQVLVELLPRLEAGAALEGVKEHAGGLLRLLPERFVHAALLSATQVRGAPRAAAIPMIPGALGPITSPRGAPHRQGAA